MVKRIGDPSRSFARLVKVGFTANAPQNRVRLFLGKLSRPGATSI
ncbi:MAG TPA: hypothetical protein VKU02_31750 [Gemmataceae bacterium]|nr:hypothetical protein [Gemmataceae bacterium]